MKTLAIAVGILALLLVPLARRVQLMSRQHRAVESLRELGAFVSYANEWDQFNQRSLQPSGLTRWYIENFDARADMVSIVEFAGDPKQLSPLTELPYTTDVAFVHGQIQPELLHYLMQVPRLERLNLSDTDANDDVLNVLASKQSLKYLNVMGSKVTPDGVRKFHSDRPDCKLSVQPDGPFMKWLERIFSAS